MKDNSKYIPKIINDLKRINPLKIILFGSYANGNFAEDSDIDLIVILDSSEISKNYDEKMKNKLLVRNSIYELTKKIPIDLVVYTKAEYEIISNNENSFHNEIVSSGKVLYEKAS